MLRFVVVLHRRCLRVLCWANCARDGFRNWFCFGRVHFLEGGRIGHFLLFSNLIFVLSVYFSVYN